MALATAISGVHLGGFLVPVLALGIESHGFRATTLGIGVFLLATVVPMTWLIRKPSEDIGLRPDGDSETSKLSQRSADEGITEADAEPEFTARQAMRDPCLLDTRPGCTWTSTISIVTLAIHLVPKLTDIGFSLSGASVVVLTYTAAALATQFVAGYLGDRLPKPPLIFVFFMFQATSLAVIAFADQAYMAYIFAGLYGIGIGGRIPLLTAIRGTTSAQGLRDDHGSVDVAQQCGMLIAPLFAGYMFDTTGSYVVPFTIFAVLNFVGAFGMLFVRKPRFDVTDRSGLRPERLRR